MVKYGEMPDRPTESLRFGTGENEWWCELNMGRTMDYDYEVKTTEINLWLTGPGEQDLTASLAPHEARDLAAALVRWAEACEADRRLIGQGA